MPLKNQNELKRLHRVFEKEADSFKKLLFSVIYIAKGWISEPSKAKLLEKLGVPLWQYYGRVNTQEEHDRQMAIVRTSSALNPIQGAQLYSYAVFEGDDPDLFLRMAKRAGNLFSDTEVLEFKTKQEAEIISKLPGLRPVEIDGLPFKIDGFQVWSGLFGRPMIVLNCNPTAVWLNFIHYNGANTNPLQGRNHDLELDPFAESLLAIEHLIEKATVTNVGKQAKVDGGIMAKLLTPAETAKEILSLFVDHFNCRPDEVVQFRNFNIIWATRRLRAEDFKPGMEYAVGEGWVEVLRNGYAFRLTASGFAAAGSTGETTSDPTPSAKLTDRDLMLRAIELARNCKSEPGKVSPKVGAVIARDGVVIGEAYRGELEPGEHGEFTLLEKKLAEETLAGATLYVTLEPCTARNEPKIACAERIIERRISKVFIGVLDPNDTIRGTGELRLRQAGIHIARFDPDLMPIIEELNRDFARQHPLGVEHHGKKPAEPSPGGNAHGHDLALFKEFLRVLPFEPTLRLLKEHDFGNSFERQYLNPLFDFASTWDSVEKEFLDETCELGRKSIYSAAKDLVMEISARTVPVGVGKFASVFSDNQRKLGHGRPPSVIEDAKVLNEKSSEFVREYEAFVRACKAKLFG